MKKIVITMLGLVALTSCKTQKNTEKANEPKTYSVRKDKDQDGIPNQLDKCPDIAGPVENEGCPWVESDGDGVIDKDDACPTVPGPPENNGCPWPDTDGDGILDKDDACPTVPGLPEYNGCPKPKSVTAMEVVSSRSISYESGRVYDHQVGDKKNVKKTTKKVDQDIDYNNEEYAALVENAFELTRNQPVSTFSIDVDNASYSNVRRMISYGSKVDKNSVRVEEMINYFRYDYPQPANGDPFSINTEYSESPWNPKHKLLKIGLQGKNIPMDRLPASNIVFLIDVSGSMDAENKLPLLKSSLKVLLNQLRPKDKVGIVVYAGSAGVVLPPTSAGEKEKIIKALDNLQAGGSTAGGAGIELAYKLAKQNFIKGGNNRVVLATDGDFNVGASSTTDIEALITEKRKTGIFLTCLGYGMGNYKDNTMEILADKGNGNYAYIDNMQEANKFLGREFAGNIYTIAKDVKVQIEFNPKYVKSYRLIGYENRKLRNEDFVNDKIDAGELGSGHTVTALYEVIPSNVESEFIPQETKLKYSEISKKKNFGDEMATVKFRYKKSDGDKSIEITKVIKKEDKSSVSPDFKFASSVAWFGLVLRNSELITKKDLSDIENLAKQGKSKDEEGYRSEFLKLIESYKTIQK
ncbi:VWA domain-containing protein [Chryseobacterium indologenes]|uniref:vWA domain-containing protein n=1 Tax=Chryseobacterium indologenes TaxID=253 RepID=UPI003016D349